MPDNAREFYLIESRGAMDNGEMPREELKEDGDFKSDFIGTSVKECQTWALEQQKRHNYFEQDIIAVIDERSARDETILMLAYFSSEWLQLECGDFGLLPRELDVWYEFRVDYRWSGELSPALHYIDEVQTWPVYFGRKEALTDENGVFDAKKADWLMSGVDGRDLFKKDHVPARL